MMTLDKLKWWMVPLMLVLMGAFLRLYRIEETLMFQGDQGRDALVVKRMIKDGDLTLLGPVTSVGNMYLGPFYYYFMAPWLALTYPNPVGPAIGVALMDTLTIFLIFIVGQEIWGRKTGLVASMLYAVMQLAVFHARFSWNPNLGSIFGLLVFWMTYRFVKSRKLVYLGLAGLGLMVLIQLHYVALLMLAVLSMGMVLIYLGNTKEVGFVFKSLLILVLILCLSLTPLLIFDWTHNHIIWNGLLQFLGEQSASTPLLTRLTIMVRETQGRSFRVLAQLIQSPNGIVDRLIVYPLLVFLIWTMMRIWRNWKNYLGVWLLLAWVLGAVIGTTVYRGTIFDHYLTFVYSGIALFYGWLVVGLCRNRWMWPVVGIFLGFYGWMNLRIIPALESGGPAATVFEDRVEQILPLVPEGSYNLALLSGSKDYRGMNYRYFFEVSTHPPLSEDNYTDAEFFVLIDEDGVENPTSHPAYEIAAYRLAEEDMIGSVLLKGKVRVMVYQTHIGESRLQ